MAKKKQRKPVSTSIPEAFKERLQEMVGPYTYRELEKTFIARPTTFRLNTINSASDTILNIKKQGFRLKQVPWYSHAYILENRTKRELTETVAYVNGDIYIQSLASMVPPLVLDPQPGERVLDLTAAPGSKTSQMAAMMQRTGELVANDNNKVRFFKLKHNMEQLGVSTLRHCEPEGRGNLLEGAANNEIATSPSAGVPRNDKKEWSFTLRLEHGASLCTEYPEYFDKILLDAPCSAEARFVEGEPKTFGYWKERKIKEMAYKQRQLLFAAWNALRPGGILVYSTCTFAPEENEVQISRLLERDETAQCVPVSLEGVPTLQPITVWKGTALHPDVKHTLRIKPDATIEGFFVAKIRKLV